MALPVQRSFEQLGTPLAEVTFCVLDLETTGGSHMDGITEVGAVKVCRGEITGTFHTLVNPGQPVPAFIRLLTGIDDDMVVEAPDIGAVLPSLLSFIGDAVIVAHNARFDVGFVNGALRAADYPPLTNRVIDTALLARKILAGEVPNHKLSTLARHLRCAHQPSHRAYADVLATIDVLHHLIERVAGYGVTTLEDLAAMSATRMDGTFSKLRLTDELPHASGVYRFLGRDGQTLYVGKATDIRSRVRSYFYGDPRRKIRDLLREAHSIQASTYATMLEAEIAEARAIASEMPPYNRAGKRGKNWYLRVTLGKHPKIGAARVAKEDGNLYLGPFSSMRTVRMLIDGLRDAARIHRCSDPRKCGSCPYADLGTCAGTDAQRAEIRQVARALTGDAAPALAAIAGRMNKLARAERFEEAAEVRERGALLASALQRSYEAQALIAAGDVVLSIGERALLIRNGMLHAAIDVEGNENGALRRLSPGVDQMPARFLTPEQQRDARVILGWLRREPETVRVLHADRPWVLPASAVPARTFQARKPERSRV